MQRVLIVDDDKSLRSALSIMLGNAGYATSEAKDGIEALKSFDDQHPDLVIMDIMLPRLNGIQACSVIRKMSPEVPPLFLSAKNTISDKAAGFHSGGDDYLTKPFSQKELLLRVEALLRRASRTTQLSQTPIEIGKLSIDPHRREVKMEGSPVSLTSKETDIVFLLACNAGRAYTREEIIAEIWGGRIRGDVNQHPHVYSPYSRKNRRESCGTETHPNSGATRLSPGRLRRTATRFRSRLSGLLSARPIPTSRACRTSARRGRAR